jgi:hypothetical protein
MIIYLPINKYTMANTRRRKSRKSKRNPSDAPRSHAPGSFAAMFAQAGGKSKRKSKRRKSRK